MRLRPASVLSRVPRHAAARHTGDRKRGQAIARRAIALTTRPSLAFAIVRFIAVEMGKAIADLCELSALGGFVRGRRPSCGVMNAEGRRPTARIRPASLAVTVPSNDARGQSGH